MMLCKSMIIAIKSVKVTFMLNYVKQLIFCGIISCCMVVSLHSAAAASATAAVASVDERDELAEYSEQLKRNMRFMVSEERFGTVQPLLSRKSLDVSIEILVRERGVQLALDYCRNILEKPLEEQQASSLIVDTIRHSYSESPSRFSSCVPVPLTRSQMQSVAYTFATQYLTDEHPEIVHHDDADFSGGVTRTLYRILDKQSISLPTAIMTEEASNTLSKIRRLFIPSPKFKNWDLLSNQKKSYWVMTENILRELLDLGGCDSILLRSCDLMKVDWLRAQIAYFIDEAVENQLACEKHQLEQRLAYEKYEVERRYRDWQSEVSALCKQGSLQVRRLFQSIQQDLNETNMLAAVAAMMDPDMLQLSDQMNHLDMRYKALVAERAQLYQSCKHQHSKLLSRQKGLLVDREADRLAMVAAMMIEPKDITYTAAMYEVDKKFDGLQNDAFALLEDHFDASQELFAQHQAACFRNIALQRIAFAQAEQRKHEANQLQQLREQLSAQAKMQRRQGFSAKTGGARHTRK